MKKMYLCIGLLISFLSAFSQLKNENEKENKKPMHWGCSIALNSIRGQMGFPGGAILRIDENGNMIDGGNRTSKSLSYSIVPKYILNNDILLRFEISKAQINQHSNENYFENAVHYLNNEEIKLSIFRLTPGVQLNFIRKKFIEAFCGISFVYSKYGKYTDSAYGEYRDSVTNNLKYWAKSNTTIDGGYAAGFGFFSGFNIYLIKHISLGAEFSTALQYYNIGGKWTLDELYQQIPGSVLTNVHEYKASYKGYRFSNIMSSFNFSVWF